MAPPGGPPAGMAGLDQVPAGVGEGVEAEGPLCHDPLLDGRLASALDVKGAAQQERCRVPCALAPVMALTIAG